MKTRQHIAISVFPFYWIKVKMKSIKKHVYLIEIIGV